MYFMNINILSITSIEGKETVRFHLIENTIKIKHHMLEYTSKPEKKLQD